MIKKKNAFTKIPSALRWGFLTLLALIAAGGGYYYFYLMPHQQETATTQTPVQTATARMGSIVLYASGTGTLTPHGEASFGFDTGGQVQEIKVKIGDQVETGQVLATLVPGSEQFNYLQAQRSLAEYTSATAIAEAEQTVADAQATFEDAQNTISSYKYKRGSAEDIAYYESQLVLAQQQVDRAQESYNQVSHLSDGDPKKSSAYSALYSAKQSYNSVAATLNWFTSTPSQTDYNVDLAAYQVAQAQLTEAQNYLAAIKGEDIPEDATGSQLSAFLKAKQDLQDAQDNLNALQLTAPIAGTVMSLDFNVGDEVGTGTVVTLADLSQPYALEVYLDESDWSNVQLGYEADVTFDLLPDQIYTGKVIEVNPGLVSVQNSNYVRCVVVLDKSLPSVLPSGTSASVDIIGGKAENAVLVPVEALRNIGNGQYTVFVMDNGTPKLRVVEVGLKDLVSAEIKSGLQVGEVVTTGIVETNQ